MSNVTGHRWIAPPAPAPPPVRLQFAPNPMQKVAFGLTAFFILLLYSRLQDFVYFLHLPGITLALATIAMIVAGNINTISKVPSTKWLVGMTVFMVCAIPFSVWHGGALETVLNLWLKAVLVYVIVTSAIVIPRYCTRLITIAAFGILCGTVIGLIAGTTSAGRMSELNLRFSDANELAQVLLIGMCLMLGYSVTPGRNQVMKTLAYVSVIIMLVAFFRTGSRGGFIGLITITLFIFIKESVATKAGILFLAVIVTACILLFLPSTLKYRYGVLLGLVQETQTSNEAIAAAGSAEGREYLLVQSLLMTARHPLFGVGAGMFAVAENSVAIQGGKARGSWHETHNMYTQVSSENGIPAFIFFVAAIFAAFRALNRVIALGKDSGDLVIVEASRSAYWIRLALLSMAASGFFLSIAYTNELQVLIAFAMGLSYSVNSYIRFSQSQPAVSTPVRPDLGFTGYRKPVRPTWSNA
jgi:O-antigen ligase